MPRSKFLCLAYKPNSIGLFGSPCNLPALKDPQYGGCCHAHAQMVKMNCLEFFDTEAEACAFMFRKQQIVQAWYMKDARVADKKAAGVREQYKKVADLVHDAKLNAAEQDNALNDEAYDLQINDEDFQEQNNDEPTKMGGQDMFTE